jgi:hypothetical protein
MTLVVLLILAAISFSDAGGDTVVPPPAVPDLEPSLRSASTPSPVQAKNTSGVLENASTGASLSAAKNVSRPMANASRPRRTQGCRTKQCVARRRRTVGRRRILRQALDTARKARVTATKATQFARAASLLTARGVKNGYWLAKAAGRASILAVRRKLTQARSIGLEWMHATLAHPRVVLWRTRVNAAAHLAWAAARAGSVAAAQGVRHGLAAVRAASAKIRDSTQSALEAERARSERGGGGRDEAARLRAEQRAQIRRILSLDEDDHYGALQLDPSARPTARMAKSAFRGLARLLHPDKCKEKRAHDAFLRLQAADSVLSDPDKRAEYDQTRALQRRHASFARQSYDFDFHAKGGGGTRRRTRSSQGARRW